MTADRETVAALADFYDREAEPICELCEYIPGAIYVHASACCDDEDGRPNLCSGTGVHWTDCNGRWIPCPACQEPEETPPPAAPARAGLAGEG